jgi:hypothetical protein
MDVVLVRYLDIWLHGFRIILLVSWGLRCFANDNPEVHIVLCFIYAPSDICLTIHVLLYQEENATEPPQSVQRGVTELVEAALSSRNLCMMDPTWHPWF